MKIFILDDCSMRHELFSQHLDGATLTQVGTADQAYRQLRHEQFDVVFLDHDLEMSGHYCGNGTEVVTAIAVLVRMNMYPSVGAVHCVHSMNPERGEFMFKELKQLGLIAKRCEEAWIEEQALGLLAASGEWTLPERWRDPLMFDEPE